MTLPPSLSPQSLLLSSAQQMLDRLITQIRDPPSPSLSPQGLLLSSAQQMLDRLITQIRDPPSLPLSSGSAPQQRPADVGTASSHRSVTLPSLLSPQGLLLSSAQQMLDRLITQIRDPPSLPPSLLRVCSSAAPSRCWTASSHRSVTLPPSLSPQGLLLSSAQQMLDRLITQIRDPPSLPPSLLRVCSSAAPSRCWTASSHRSVTLPPSLSPQSLLLSSAQQMLDRLITQIRDPPSLPPQGLLLSSAQQMLDRLITQIRDPPSLPLSSESAPQQRPADVGPPYHTDP